MREVLVSRVLMVFNGCLTLSATGYEVLVQEIQLLIFNTLMSLNTGASNFPLESNGNF